MPRPGRGTSRSCGGVPTRPVRRPTRSTRWRTPRATRTAATAVRATASSTYPPPLALLAPKLHDAPELPAVLRPRRTPGRSRARRATTSPARRAGRPSSTTRCLRGWPVEASRGGSARGIFPASRGANGESVMDLPAGLVGMSAGHVFGTVPSPAVRGKAAGPGLKYRPGRETLRPGQTRPVPAEGRLSPPPLQQEPPMKRPLELLPTVPGIRPRGAASPGRGGGRRVGGRGRTSSSPSPTTGRGRTPGPTATRWSRRPHFDRVARGGGAVHATPSAPRRRARRRGGAPDRPGGPPARERRQPLEPPAEEVRHATPTCSKRPATPSA